MKKKHKLTSFISIELKSGDNVHNLFIYHVYENQVQYLLSFHKKKVLLSSFVHCHFSYASLACMFHSRDINNKINRIQERALRILYNDEEGVLEQLLRRDKGLRSMSEILKNC